MVEGIKTYDSVLDKKRTVYLKSNGWEFDTAHGESQTEVGMEVWNKFTDYGAYKLYIHYKDKKWPNIPACCNLYYGSNEADGEEFSLRNMISEMKKRDV